MPYSTAEFGPTIDTQDLGAVFLDQMQEAEGAESLAIGQRRLHRQEHQRPGAGDPPHRRRIAQLLPRRVQPVGRAARRPLPEDPGEAGGPQGAAGPGAQGLLRAPRRRGKWRPSAGTTGGPRRAGRARLAVRREGDPAPDDRLRVQRDPARQGQHAGGDGGRLAPFAFQEQEGRFVDTVEFLLVVAHRETGEFFRYDQKIEMRLQAETREKLARTWYPIVRDFELAPGGLPGQDRRARQEQRPDRHRRARVRGAGPERSSGSRRRS